MQGWQTLTQGLPIRGFNLIYEKNACFLWKIIWFLFCSIAVGLPLIMKNNIMHVASAARFARPCSFDGIFHYIFAHLGLYFVDKRTDFLLEFSNWLRSISINLIFIQLTWNFLSLLSKCIVLAETRIMPEAIVQILFLMQNTNKNRSKNHHISLKVEKKLKTFLFLLFPSSGDSGKCNCYEMD